MLSLLRGGVVGWFFRRIAKARCDRKVGACLQAIRYAPVLVNENNRLQAGSSLRSGLRFLRVLIVLAVGATVNVNANAAQDVYIWQRSYDAVLRQTLTGVKSEDEIGGLFPLVAEVKWSRGEPSITRVAVDYAALAATGKRIGLVLRVGAYSGKFTADDTKETTTRTLVSLSRELIANARKAGVVPTELQIDFDCAESKLAGYRVWLEALRGAIDVPLVFTALPSWMKNEKDFAALANAASGFVLQVHSLEKPTGGPDAPYTLCDPPQALVWARRAADFGRPFRVALPTYGYRLAFDTDGKFFALSAEGSQPSWPRGTQIRSVRTESSAMIALAKTLSEKPLANCSGVIWFRLPVAGDRLNWDAVTFRRVLAGEVPKADLRVEARAPVDSSVSAGSTADSTADSTAGVAAAASETRGLKEIWLVNRGETSEPLPDRVMVKWIQGGRLLVSDGLGGYRVVAAKTAGVTGVELVADAVLADVQLAPGRSRQIGWMRFLDELSLTVSLPPTP